MKVFLLEYKYSILIAFILVIIYFPLLLNSQFINLNNILRNKYLIAFIFGFIIFGIVADLLTSIIMKKVWDKTTESYKEVLRIQRKKMNVPFWLDSKNRRVFIWAPRLIGVLERIFYTTAVIFNQFGLIGVWLVFKAIGNWNDFSSTGNTKNGTNNEEGTTRIRPNNFIIGTGITLIFGILGGILFRLWIDPNILSEVIGSSYKVGI